MKIYNLITKVIFLFYGKYKPEINIYQLIDKNSDSDL